MKKTRHTAAGRLRETKPASRARSDTDTVRQGAYDRLRALRGQEPQATDTRRREASKRPVS